MDQYHQAIPTIYTSCCRPLHGHNQLRLSPILRNKKGFDLIPENFFRAFHSDHAITSVLFNELPLTPVVNDKELRKSMQPMLSLFSQITRPGGEVHKTFTVRGAHILDQIDALQITRPHHLSVFSFMTTRKSRKTASKTLLTTTTMGFPLTSIKSTVLFDEDVQARRGFQMNERNQCPVSQTWRQSWALYPQVRWTSYCLSKISNEAPPSLQATCSLLSKYLPSYEFVLKALPPYISTRRSDVSR